MRAVVLRGITPAEDITLEDVPVPSVVPGWVLIKVKAFGMNHSELLLRSSEIEEGYIHKPVIPGIECVGVVEDPSDSDLSKGETVIALMGGMGRSFDGSYAEYALLPAAHVFPVKTGLGWDELAAIPETYYTAWGSLFECLDLRADDEILIRGASCALGHAALQISKALGCKVTATVRREERISSVMAADDVLLDHGILDVSSRFDKALDLVGPRTISDTLRTVRKGGIVCCSGILGGVYTLDGFDPIKDIPNGVYLSGFFSNYPDSKTIDNMMKFLDENGIRPRIGARFSFLDINKACALQDRGCADGKIVVTMGDGSDDVPSV